MKRIKLTIEYEGANYSGWQRQRDARSIQEEIEKAVSKFSGMTSVTVCASGRTDAGVHAIEQVAHVDVSDKFDAEAVKRAVNHYLGNQNITILHAEEVSTDFHARFSAKKRRYLYRVINRKPKLSLEKHRAWHVPVSLDLEKMKEGASFFLGTHDFTSFRTIRCQAKNPIRAIDTFEIIEDKGLIEFWVEGPSFLHHQVRNMVGTLVEIGKGRWQPDHIQKIFLEKKRAAAGQTAPPEGLYFISVSY